MRFRSNIDDDFNIAILKDFLHPNAITDICFFKDILGMILGIL
jgi:hypothetical protein